MSTAHDVLHQRIGAIEELAMRRERNRIVAILRLRLPASEADYIETLIRVTTAEEGADTTRSPGSRDWPTAPSSTAAAALNRGPSGSATGLVGS